MSLLKFFSQTQRLARERRVLGTLVNACSEQQIRTCDLCHCVYKAMFPETFSIYMLAVLFFWVGLLLPPPPLIRFPSKSWHLTMLQGQFLCESTVKHTGGCTIHPNLGLWLMCVYVNSCVCFCVCVSIHEVCF